MLFVVPAQVTLATPTNPDVVSGAAGVTQSGNTTNVDVLTSRAVINWDSLDTNQSQILQFLHDGGHFAVLNRVMQGGATQFDGSLFGNQGTIIIVNPNGIVFGPTALVQAYSFTASSLDISNGDFMNGVYRYAGDGVGEVANYGTISAEQVALIGKKVLNAGTISSPGGYTIMASGDSVYLGSEGSSVVVEVAGVTVPDGATEGLGDVINEGTIDAADGKIILAAGDTYTRAIEGLDRLSVAVGSGVGRVGQFGTITADGTDGNGGEITLTAADMVVLGDSSVTTANAGSNGDGGQIIAYSPDTALFSENAVIQAKGGSESGNGGFVEVSGKDHVEIWGQVDTTAANGRTGTFLIDPTNIKIDTLSSANMTWDGFEFYQNGGSTQNSLSATVLQNQLASTDVIVQTDRNGSPTAEGWIWVATAINWSSDSSLTLDANGRIMIEAPITNTGNGEFAAYARGELKPGNISVNADVTAGSITMEAGDPTLVTDIRSNLNIADGVTVRATSGDLNLSAREHITIDGQVIAELGDINITADSDYFGRGYVKAGGHIDAEQGSVDILGRAVTVNTVHAAENLTITGMQEVDPAFEAAGYIDTTGLLSTDNGNIELGIKTTPQIIHETGDPTYPPSEDYAAEAVILIGDNIVANGDVLLHNQAEFYADGDQRVTAEEGMILAESTLTKTESGSLYLHAGEDVSLAGDVTNTVGGVSIIADNGSIFTPGGNDDTLNVAVTGTSDETQGIGADLPDGSGKAAIILRSGQDMNIGENASLTANGAYGSDPDDRAGIGFLDEDANIGGYDRDQGIPSDIAIYVGSQAGNVNIQTPNIAVNNEGEGSATVVFDAYDTVTMPSIEAIEQARIDLENDNLFRFRLEVASRITEWLSQAINGGKLPYATNTEAMEALLGDDYVLRGAGQDNPAIAAEENSNRAWVLEDPTDEPAPVAPLARLDFPELKGCPVEMDAAAAELAMNSDQLQLLIGNSLASNPNLQPCEACQKLVTAATILSDADGQRLAAMSEIFNTLAPADAPFTPEVQAAIATAFANLANDDPQYAMANEYVNAFADYVAVIGTELQVPVGDPVVFALEKHGQAITGSENPNIAAFIVAQAGGANL
jgi:filamentous hemagglutinin family protein